MPKLYLGLRLQSAQLLQWSDDNVAYNNLTIPAGTVWLSPYHCVTDLRARLLTAGMNQYASLVINGTNDALTVNALLGAAGFGLKFAAATVLDAYLGSPGNVWLPPLSPTTPIGQLNPVFLEAILDSGWRERSVQRYIGGVAVRGDGSGEALTQAVGLETMANMRVRVANTGLKPYLAPYLAAMMTAMQAAPLCLWYDDTVAWLTYLTQQHIGGWIAASEDRIALTAEFDLIDHWTHRYQLRVLEVANA